MNFKTFIIMYQRVYCDKKHIFPIVREENGECEI